jgi:hypothetical protein
VGLLLVHVLHVEPGEAYQGAAHVNRAAHPHGLQEVDEADRRQGIAEALDDDAVLIDTSTPRRTKRVEPDNAAAKGPREVDKPKPKAIPKDVAEELGEEFEEIR